MEAAPTPIDILDFQFKLKNRLCIFKNQDFKCFGKPCNIITTAPRYGLIFIASHESYMQVLTTEEIEKYDIQNNETTAYARRLVPLQGPASFVSANCDSTLLAVVQLVNGCMRMNVFTVASFLDTTAHEINPIHNVILSQVPNVSAVQVDWNPTMPSYLTICKSDGSLSNLEVTMDRIANTDLPPASGSTCFSWSPKGKQLAVGNLSGAITQFKPDLKSVKVIAAPPSGDPNCSFQIVALLWISNYQFIGVYQQMSGACTVIVVDAPKSAGIVCKNYDDITYSSSDKNRPVQFYIGALLPWNTVTIASANSAEVGLLGVLPGDPPDKWTQCIVADHVRAELPLCTETKQDTLPVGMAFNLATTQPTVNSDTGAQMPPMPMLMILSHEGLLSVFTCVNTRADCVALCTPPENITLRPAIGMFKSPQLTVATTPSFGSSTVQAASVFATASVPVIPITTSTATPAIQPFGVKSVADAVLPTVTASSPLAFSKPVLPAAAVTSTPQIIVNPMPPQQMSITPQRQAAPSFHMSVPSTPMTPPPPIAKASANSSIMETSVTKDVVATEAQIAQFVGEECLALESELRVLLEESKSVRVDNVGDNGETPEQAAETCTELSELCAFVQELAETSNGQVAEIHALKQSVIQSWAWYEDARSRFTMYNDPALAALLKHQPLDPASDRQLAEIRHLMQYLDAQLYQANGALDEQWMMFQDSCKQNARVRVPSIEIIYQTMAKHGATLQRQAYVLKDIAARMRSRTKYASNLPSLLLWRNNTVHNKSDASMTLDASDLETSLAEIHLDADMLLDVQRRRVAARHENFSPSKRNAIRNALHSRAVRAVAVTKPAMDTSSAITDRLNILLAAPISPIAVARPAKPAISSVSPRMLPHKLDFEQSTPKPMKTVSVTNLNAQAKPALTLQNNPTAIAKELGSASGFATAPTFQIPNTASTAPSVAAGSSGTASQLTGLLTKPFAGFGQPAAFPFVAPAPVTSAPQAPIFGAFSGDKLSSTPSFAFAPPPATSSSITMLSIDPKKPLFGSALTSHASVAQATPLTANAQAVSGLFTFKAASSPPPAASPVTTSAMNTQIFGSVAAKVTPTTSMTASASSNIFASTITSLASTSSFFSSPLSIPIPPTSSASTPFVGFATTIATDNTSKPLTTLFEKTSTSSSAAIKIPNLFGAVSAANTAPVAAASSASSVTISTVPSSISSFGFSSITVPSSASNVSITTVTNAPAIKPEFTPPSTSVQTSFSAASTIASSTPNLGLFGKTTVSTATSTTGLGFFSSSSSSTTAQSTTTPSSTPSLFSTISAPDSLSTSTFSLSSPFGSTASTAASIPFGSSTTVTGSLPFGVAVSSVTSPSATSNLFASTLHDSTAVSAASVSSVASISDSPFAAGSVTTSASSIFKTGTVFGVSPATSSSTTTSTTPPTFGVAATTPSPISPFFGAASTTTTAGAQFGIATTVSAGTAPFGTTSTAATSTVASPFAAATISASLPAFGSSSTLANPATSPFGSPISAAPPFSSAPATSPFVGIASAAPAGSGQSVFGGAASFGGSNIFSKGSTNIFGSTATAATVTTPASSSIFGTGVAGAATPGGSVFGAKPSFSSPAFGSTANNAELSFGSLNVATSTSSASPFTGAFGSAQSPAATVNPFARQVGQPTAFGSPTSNIFGSPAAATATPTSIFGGGAASGSSVFGQPAAFGQQPATASGIFGGSANSANIFGSPKPNTGAGAASGGIFSSGSSVSQSGFGASATFGGAPAFGSPGSPSAFGASPSFGGAPAFGSATSPSGAAFGGAPKMFGSPQPAGPQSSTFANLATQNTLGFGNLAQNTASPQSAGFAAGSSFSTWR